MKIRTMAYVLVLALVSVLVTAPGAAAATNIANASQFPGQVSGQAWAGYLTVPAGLAQVSVGPLFKAILGCGVTAATSSSSAASSSLSNVGTTGTTSDNVTTTRSTTSAGVTSTANVSTANLLGGMITATTIHSVASTQATSSGATSTGGATFTNLKVAGKTISSSPAKNTKISLPGIGTLTLNEISGPTNGANASSITVTAIDIKVSLSNSLSLPIGAEIRFGFAQSSYIHTATDSTVSANSYGLEATGLSGDVTSGPWANANASCAGGSDTQTLTSEKVNGVVTTGTMSDTATATIGASTTTASASSTVNNISLLGGLITGGAVTVNAAVNTGADTATGAMTLTNLKVLGVPIPINPQVNLTITIPGYGKVIINEQSLKPSKTSASASVNAIDVQITQKNILNIPVGAKLIVAHARVTAAVH